MVEKKTLKKVSSKKSPEEFCTALDKADPKVASLILKACLSSAFSKRRMLIVPPDDVLSKMEKMTDKELNPVLKDYIVAKSFPEEELGKIDMLRTISGNTYKVEKKGKSITLNGVSISHQKDLPNGSIWSADKALSATPAQSGGNILGGEEDELEELRKMIGGKVKKSSHKKKRVHKKKRHGGACMTYRGGNPLNINIDLSGQPLRYSVVETYVNVLKSMGLVEPWDSWLSSSLLLYLRESMPEFYATYCDIIKLNPLAMVEMLVQPNVRTSAYPYYYISDDLLKSYLKSKYFMNFEPWLLNDAFMYIQVGGETQTYVFPKQDVILQLFVDGLNSQIKDVMKTGDVQKTKEMMITSYRKIAELCSSLGCQTLYMKVSEKDAADLHMQKDMIEKITQFCKASTKKDADVEKCVGLLQQISGSVEDFRKFIDGVKDLELLPEGVTHPRTLPRPLTEEQARQEQELSLSGGRRKKSKKVSKKKQHTKK